MKNPYMLVAEPDNDQYFILTYYLKKQGISLTTEVARAKVTTDVNPILRERGLPTLAVIEPTLGGFENLHGIILAHELLQDNVESVMLGVFSRLMYERSTPRASRSGVLIDILPEEISWFEKRDIAGPAEYIASRYKALTGQSQ